MTEMVHHFPEQVWQDMSSLGCNSYYVGGDSILNHFIFTNSPSQVTLLQISLGFLICISFAVCVYV